MLKAQLFKDLFCEQKFVEIENAEKKKYCLNGYKLLSLKT